MKEEHLKKKFDAIKEQIRTEETIDPGTEEKLLKEIENLQSQIQRAKNEEFHHFQQIAEHLEKILSENDLIKKRQFLKNTLENFSDSFTEYEESHPKMVKTIEQIIYLFKGWGLS